MAGGMATMFDRDRGQLLEGGAVFMQVALRDQAVGRWNADAIGTLELRMAEFGQRSDRPVARHAGGAVVASHAQHMAALAGGHQRLGEHHHDAGSGTA